MIEDLVFRFLFMTMWIAFLGSRSYYAHQARIPGRKRSRQQRWREMAKYERVELIILRLILFYLLISLIMLYVLVPSWLVWFQLLFPSWLRWFGAGLGIVTIPLLIWIGRTLGRHVSSSLEIKQGHSLVTSGPYSRVRHPMYTIYLVFNFAMVLVSANWLLILLIIIGSYLLYWRIKAEEKMMLDHFGDEYRTYMKSTGRLLPRIRPRLEKEDPTHQ
ncbi:MAG: isoprenylcysteine carboxylmethyltransferase family protein [Candidatus Hodarchaeota archaeon]